MKISEMTNDVAADALVKIAPAIENILKDENTKPLLDKLSNSEGMSPIQVVGTVLPQIVAFCMKDHKKDVYAVVAALTLKPVSAVGNMNFVATVKELKESIDEDFLSFFKSSGSSEEQTGA